MSAATNFYRILVCLTILLEFASNCNKEQEKGRCKWAGSCTIAVTHEWCISCGLTRASNENVKHLFLFAELLGLTIFPHSYLYWPYPEYLSTYQAAGTLGKAHIEHIPIANRSEKNSQTNRKYYAWRKIVKNKITISNITDASQMLSALPSLQEAVSHQQRSPKKSTNSPALDLWPL